MSCSEHVKSGLLIEASVNAMLSAASRRIVAKNALGSGRPLNRLSEHADVDFVTRAMASAWWIALPQCAKRSSRQRPLRANKKQFSQPVNPFTGSQVCPGRLRTSDDRTSSQSPGFTLIELLIIVSVLGILAALAVPIIANSSDQARTEAMASNVSHVRAMIAYHSGAGTVPLNAHGYPASIDVAWFREGKMPEHAWTGSAMVVQVVNAAHDVVFPAVKVFNPLTPGATSAWYNATNGAFCALVPPKATDAETVALFNAANKANVTLITQTTN